MIAPESDKTSEHFDGTASAQGSNPQSTSSENAHKSLFRAIDANPTHDAAVGPEESRDLSLAKVEITRLEYDDLGVLKNPGMWHKEVDGPAVVRRIIEVFLVCTSMLFGPAFLLALWIINSHALGRAKCSPLLLLPSFERDDEKAVTLEILRHLCKDGFATASIAPSTMLKVLEEQRHTLILEQADSLLENSIALNYLRAAWDRDHGALTLERQGQIVRVKPFGAIALFTTGGDVSSTLRDQWISVDTSGSATNCEIKAHTVVDENLLINLANINSHMQRWVADNDAKLQIDQAPELNLKRSKARKTFMPLFLIARALGPTWSKQALDEARLQFDDLEEMSIGVHLLIDVERSTRSIRKINAGIHTKHLVDLLLAVEGDFWKTANHGNPINAVFVGKLLSPLLIKTSTTNQIRVGGQVNKGYWFQNLQRAFETHIPPDMEDD